MWKGCLPGSFQIQSCEWELHAWNGGMRTLLLFASFCSSDILGFYVGVMTNPPKACRTKSRGFHAGYQRRLAPRKHGCGKAEGKPWYALEGLNCARAPLGGCTPREGRGEALHPTSTAAPLPTSDCRCCCHCWLLPSREPPTGCSRPTQISALAQLVSVRLRYRLRRSVMLLLACAEL